MFNSLPKLNCEKCLSFEPTDEQILYWLENVGFPNLSPFCAGSYPDPYRKGSWSWRYRMSRENMVWAMRTDKHWAHEDREYKEKVNAR